MGAEAVITYLFTCNNLAGRGDALLRNMRRGVGRLPQMGHRPCHRGDGGARRFRASRRSRHHCAQLPHGRRTRRGRYQDRLVHRHGPLLGNRHAIAGAHRAGRRAGERWYEDVARMPSAAIDAGAKGLDVRSQCLRAGGHGNDIEGVARRRPRFGLTLSIEILPASGRCFQTSWTDTNFIRSAVAERRAFERN